MNDILRVRKTGVIKMGFVEVYCENVDLLGFRTESKVYFVW